MASYVMPKWRKKGPLTEGALFCLSSGGLSAPPWHRPANRARLLPDPQASAQSYRRRLPTPASTQRAQLKPRLACPLYVWEIIHLTDHPQAAPFLGRDSESTLEIILQIPSKSFTFRHADLVTGESSCKTR